jgi:hypothetical protein
MRGGLETSRTMTADRAKRPQHTGAEPRRAPECCSGLIDPAPPQQSAATCGTTVKQLTGSMPETGTDNPAPDQTFGARQSSSPEVPAISWVQVILR